MKITIGTTNKYKIREIASVVNPLGIELGIINCLNPDETGNSLEENALIKVNAYAKYATMKETLKQQHYVLAEDSGLFVQSLSGLPGIHSARFSDCIIKNNNKVIDYVPSNRDRETIDKANCKRVIRLMKKLPEGNAKYFRCISAEAYLAVCLCVSDLDGNIVFKTLDKSEGWIVEKPSGTDGFGYDCIFASESSYGKTWAEIDGMRKNLISHRRKAIEKFTQWIINANHHN